MSGQEVAVVAWGLFAPGFAGVDAWLSGRQDPEMQLPAARALHPRLRRRTSMLTKALAEVYFEALNHSAFVASELAAVFGSALGEAATMIELLDQMWGEEGVLSPMRFVSSVHNAASGVMSIATSNRGFTTSLGADYDTPAMALIEGIGQVLAHDQQTLVCCGDEMIIKDLVPADLRWELMAASVALAPVAQAPDAPRLQVVQDVEQTLAAPQLPAVLARNPCAGMLDLVDALARGKRGALRLDRGQGHGYFADIA